MIFGKVMNCPALQVNKAVTGTTLTGVGILSGLDLWTTLPDGADDSQFFLSLLQMVIQISHLRRARACWEALTVGTDPDGHTFQLKAHTLAELDAQIAALQTQINEGGQKLAKQRACVLARRQAQIDAANAKGLGANPINILGGEDFPQNTPITINIGGGLFTGHFVGTLFYVSSRRRPADEATAADAYSDATEEPAVCLEDSQKSYYRFETTVPMGCGDLPVGQVFGQSDKIVDAGVVITATTSTTTTSGTDAIAQQFWADPGASVTISQDEPITYIVSIVPGTVLAVKAYKQLTGERRLVDVPTEPLHGFLRDLWHGHGRAGRRQYAAQYDHGSRMERRSLCHVRVERRPGHRGHPQVHHRELHRLDVG